MTEELFRQDSYLKSCEATVVAAGENSLILDRTVFYPTGGGQPGDTGCLRTSDGATIEVLDTVNGPDGIVHQIAEGVSLPAIGDTVVAEIDWARRYRFMRMHSCMHLLCAIVPFGVTGGSIRDGSARLDFDAPEPLDKVQINEQLTQLVREDHPIDQRWITDAELDEQPELVRTLSVQPPRGGNRIRLIDIKGVDLQPCGGTHLKSSGEVGGVRVKKIEKKGRQNRRITVVFDE